VLEPKLTGVRISRRSKKTAVVAYADITIFVTAPKDIPVIRDTIRTYERATGAMLNIRKSKAIAVGAWETTIDMMGCENVPHTESGDRECLKRNLLQKGPGRSIVNWQ
jgi:hypothetical protein